MNNEAAIAVVREVLSDIAPEADLTTVDTGAPLHEVLDLDSMDFLNFVTNLRRPDPVDIPERDYPLVTTIDACVAYLTSHSEPGTDASAAAGSR